MRHTSELKTALDLVHQLVQEIIRQSKLIREITERSTDLKP